MQTDADIEAIWEKSGIENGRELMRKATEEMMAALPAGVLAERREFDRAERGGFVEFREAGMAPDVPTVILLAGKSQPLPAAMDFPGADRRFDPYRKRFNRQKS